MSKIVFERLKVNEKKKILAGTSDSGCSATPTCPPLPNPLSPCFKTIVSGCSVIPARSCMENEPTGVGELEEPGGM